MMILVNFLVATTLTTLVQSTPLLYSTNHRREPVNEDHDVYVPYLINGRGASVNDIYWQQLREEENAKIKNGSTIDGIGQIKRAHSLSVTNSIDVLRDQLLLALARRKALQSQQQIQANRRYLDSIGKRSLKNSAINSPQNFEMKNKHLFGNQYIENPARNQSPFESHLDESIDWYNIGDVGDVYEKDNQLQEMAIDEFGVL